MNPKIFISHASEDKKRFVLDFATKLRSKGIDAWVDQWEMYPGDSLIDKIFEEGLKNAQAVVVVLSQNSVQKPWVKEELNASMIKKINHNSKLIPVVLDNCIVPECLKSTVWERIKNINNYEEELNRIVMSILEENMKPPLGQVPRYSQTIIDMLPDLTRVDNIIMKVACDKAIERGSIYTIMTNSILGNLKKYDITFAQLKETLEILDGRGYIKGVKVISGDMPYFAITTYGFDKYVRKYMKEYNEIEEIVSFQIVNMNITNSELIAQNIDKPKILVNHIIYILQSRGLVKIFETIDGNIFISHVSPELKRILNNI